MLSADALRRAQLAKIHLAKKRLGLTDDVYRMVIARVTRGKTSSADLDSRERGQLLDEFSRLGFRNPPAPGREAGGDGSTRAGGAEQGIKNKDASPAGPQIAKIRALWRVLENAGAVGLKRSDSEHGVRASLRSRGLEHQDPDKALRQFVKRQTGRDALEWLTAADANKVIEGLKQWIVRIANRPPELLAP